MVSEVTIGTKIKKYQFPLNINVSDWLLKFFGYYIAEGHASEKFFILSNGDIEIISDIKEACINLNLKLHHRPHTVDYQISSLFWTKIFHSTCGNISSKKKLPPFWTSLSDKQLGVLLSAYFSGDGGVEEDEVTCTTVSKKLSSDLVYALMRFGIMARARKREVKIPGKKNRSTCWNLRISGQKNLNLFFDYIGFTLYRKQTKLKQLLSKKYNTNVDVIPLDGMWLSYIRKEMNLFERDVSKASGVCRSYISMIEHNNRNPSREIFLRIINFFITYAQKNNFEHILDRLKDIKSFSNLSWLKIRSIEKVRHTGYVYDFAVQDNETFLAGFGGMFVHNTFTVANVIEQVQKPTLVIAHNKTLAAQLCNEFREFFPDNAVEYFVSYYDYYQPEAYMPGSDTYIEKEAQINEEIDRLRHACTQALLTRQDVIVVSSVSAIYNLGNPLEYEKTVLHLYKGQELDRRGMMEQLVSMHFERTTLDLRRGQFRMRGQVFEIMPVNEEMIYRFEVSKYIDVVELVDPVTRKIKSELHDAWFFPAKHHVISQHDRETAFIQIRKDLDERLAYFKKQNKPLEYERLKRKTKYDLEMIKNIGYCNGIENYSSYFDGRAEGEPPFTLLDYFSVASGTFGTQKAGFLTVIDESHVTLPQIRGMYNGDQARKNMLVEHGFRLPSAKDNRPLMFEEFNKRVGQMLFVSATPTEYEIKESQAVVEQIVRPTGLIDPEVIILPVTEKKGKNISQVDDVIERIKQRVSIGERTLVTTLTKKMVEDLSEYLKAQKIKVEYLHSDIKTIERVDVIMKLRKGEIDVIVGVNLLREGLDIPEVSLVAILDADKEGFLRNETSLIQTIGRAARNVNGQVLMYADVVTKSIKKAIEETDRRRVIQLAYNKKHGITPKTIEKSIRNILEEFGIDVNKGIRNMKGTKLRKNKNNLLDLDLKGDARPLDVIIKDKEKQMKEAAHELEFELAAILRDEMRELKLRNKGK
ncbi:MAG: excinuclease ABC subunit UvrB [Candidatus Magasanikbacteria bacterium]|nr:excinuclease ABC subunit UvrB [Candidatus Magasanikbacteria bacterium]